MFKIKTKKRDANRKKTASGAAFVRGSIVKVVPAAATFLVLASIMVILALSLANLSYFRLKAIETRGGEGLTQFKAAAEELMRANQGKSIFAVDIRAVAEHIRLRFPDIRETVVRRKFPDRLSISVVLRRPVALLGSDAYYPVDAEGVILPFANASYWQRLPVIAGVAVRQEDKVGKRCASKALAIALDLIAQMEATKVSSDYAVTTIDVSDPKNVTFTLEDGVEVRIGNERFRQRLETLSETLKNPKLVLSRIKYIDLRFKDIYIGPK